jgi:hypothetical protein
MFVDCVVLSFMLFNSYSMLENYMLECTFIMVYVLELIVKLSKFPTNILSMYDSNQIVH